jgi:hypothetical protein
VLAYLIEQGITWRGPLRERREDARPEPDRREADSTIAAWWDHAVFLLNAGRIDHARDVFLRIADAFPDDLRVRELIQHLDFANAREARPDLVERRDPLWRAFDDALATMLRAGRCPSCAEPFRVELGGQTICHACGASFSAYVLGQARRNG